MIATMHRIFGTAAACIVFAAFAACGATNGERASPSRQLEGPSARAYAYVVVSVADMQQALELWEGRFGLEISRHQERSDAGLARVWGLPDDAIAEEALLNTPGLVYAGVHLVRFARPGEPVRAQGEPDDLAPQGLVIAVDDLEVRRAELVAAGYAVRPSMGVNESGKEPVSQLHVAGPEALDLYFRERRAKPEVLSSKGYAVALQMLASSADIDREAAFFRDVIGLEPLNTGATRLLGARDIHFGRIELSQPTEPGRDLYPRAAPPARGLLSITYVVATLDPLLTRGRAAGIADHGEVNSIYGVGRMASVTSPAGLRIDFIQL